MAGRTPEDGLTITVFYSCRDCGLRKVGCDVPARAEESVVDWMRETGRRLSTDHSRRSPERHPVALVDILIPMTGTAKVGGPSIQ